MNEASWITLGLSIVAMIGSAYSARQARQTKKDALEHDTKLTVLAQANQRCEEDRVNIRVELKDCHNQHIDSNARIALLELKLEQLSK